MSAATDRLDALQAQFPRSEFAGHLDFSERCAAYYLLKRGFKQTLIAQTFGVSSATITKLKHANEGRYGAIVREYARIGHEAFGDRYFTPEIEARLQRFRMGAPTKADTALRTFGPNPTARAAAGQYLIRAVDGTQITTFIRWVAGEGWVHAQDEEPGAYQSEKRFPTSTMARKAMLSNYAIDADEILTFIPVAP